METLDKSPFRAKEQFTKSRFILYLLFIFCFSIQNTFGSTNIWIRPYEIRFDYESGHDDDAVTIRDDDGDPLIKPEWKYSPTIRNNFAYIKSQTDRKIKVKFYSNCSDMHLIINLTVTSGTGIGEICNYVIMNYEEQQEVTITLDGTIPNNAGKRTFTWKWEIYGITNESGYCSAKTTYYTNHMYYTVLSIPQDPMEEPWTSVLNYACDWASGQSSSLNAVTKITEGAYINLDVEYYGGGTHATLPNFYLTNMLNDGWADCRDMSAIVQVFSGAVGISGIQVRRINGQFNYKPILPIGKSSWNAGIWNFHQVGYFNNVYDACLKLDQSSPRIPVNEAINGGYKDDLYSSGYWSPQSPTAYTNVY